MYDERQVQDTVLALMHLNAREDTYVWRAWKSLAWEATDGLHARELTDDPRSKAKSVARVQTRPRPAPQSRLDMRL